MPKQYVLKRPVMDANRIKKLAKEIIGDGQIDRKKAFEAYEYFKNLVDADPTSETDASKKAMVESLKLAQSAKTTTTKLMDLMVKLELAADSKEREIAGGSIYQLLNEKSNE